MKKVNIFLIILGFLFVGIPFLVNTYNLLRLLSLLIGIIILSIGLIIYLPRKIIRTIFIPIFLIISICLLDFFLVNVTKFYPIIAVKHVSSPKVEVFNSLFYRVYSCNENLVVDNNYKKGYQCGNNDITKVNINKFLENPYETYDEYHDKFVHIEGKITMIVGSSGLSMSAYDDKISVNGHVTFDHEKKVVVDNLKIDAAGYYVYDFIEVIGPVSSIKKDNDAIEIHLTDAKLIPSSIYDDYELIVNEIDDQTITKTEEKYYYMGLQGIYYRYDENNIYDLPYLLLDKRESIDNLIKNTKAIEEEKYSYYILKDYTLVKCSKERIIFVNKNITDFDGVCNIKEN